MSFTNLMGLKLGSGLTVLVASFAVNSVSGTVALAGQPKAFELLAQCQVDNDTNVRLTVDGSRITEVSPQFNTTSYILKVEHSEVPQLRVTDISTSDGSHFSLRSLGKYSSDVEVYKNGAYYGPCFTGFIDPVLTTQLAEQFKVKKPKYEFATCRTNNAGGQVEVTAQAGPVAGSVLFEGVYDKGDGQETMVMVATSAKESNSRNLRTLSLKGQGAYAYYGLGYHPRGLKTLNINISPISKGFEDGNITSDVEGKEDFAQNCVFRNIQWVKRTLNGSF